MPAVQMYGNLTAGNLLSGQGRLLLSVPLESKVIVYCALHQISAHALPRNAEELIDMVRFMGWQEALGDPFVMEALCTKPPGLYPDIKAWTATWKVFTLAWAEEGGFVWGKTMKELDREMESMHPALKMDRVREERAYISPAALAKDTVEEHVVIDQAELAQQMESHLSFLRDQIAEAQATAEKQGVNPSASKLVNLYTSPPVAKSKQVTAKDNALQAKLATSRQNPSPHPPSTTQPSLPASPLEPTKLQPLIRHHLLRPSR
ncbi:hypothetical protein BST61_g11463 [Cercospora zeina]